MDTWNTGVSHMEISVSIQSQVLYQPQSPWTGTLRTITLWQVPLHDWPTASQIKYDWLLRLIYCCLDCGWINAMCTEYRLLYSVWIFLIIPMFSQFMQKMEAFHPTMPKQLSGSRYLMLMIMPQSLDDFTTTLRCLKTWKHYRCSPLEPLTQTQETVGR